MHRRIILTLGAVALVAHAEPLFAQSSHAGQTQSAFAVDSILANKGKRLFTERGCLGCHTVGKGELSAPDLGGLLERRTPEWVKKWLRDPAAMLESDEIAKSMMKQYNFRMPNLRLKEDEILALMHHIEAETRATRLEASGSQ